MGFDFLCCLTSSNRSKKRSTTLIETSLDFSRCNLSNLDLITDADFDFPELITELDFSYNKLEELNPILLRCRNLKVLNLADNQLSTLPDQLANALSKISSINLSNNRFESIPTFFANNTFNFLHTIDLSNNPIGKILDGTVS
jgi:Leucine-rich repeat (LRR) protein